MRISTAVLLLPALLVVLVGAAVASPAAAGPTAGGDAASNPAALQPGATTPVPSALQPASAQSNESRTLTYEIQIRDDGDARISIRMRFPNETATDRETFDTIAGEFRARQHDLGYQTFRRAVERADPTVDREMRITDEERSVERTADAGTLVHSFTWHNFANVSDGRISVGDAFRTERGLWLRTLERDHRLVVRAPDEYSVTESPQGPRVRDGESLIWTGPRTFERSDLQVTFARETDSNVGTYLALALVGLVILALGALVLWRETRDDGGVPSIEDSPVDGLFAGLPWVDEDVDGPAVETSTADGGGTSRPAAEPPAESVDPELLSDEERVEHLLDENGGRMKQSNIVAETGWSNAKVSQLLSDMDENDRVDKLRIGRENLITLPDEDVTADEE